MPDSFNPYAAPRTRDATNPDAWGHPNSYYIDGKNLFVRDGAELPNLCIKTGEPINSGKRRKKKLYWSSPWLILLLLLSPLVYIIVYYCVRKGFSFQYSISLTSSKALRLTLDGIVDPQL